jgi:lysozyme
MLLANELKKVIAGVLRAVQPAQRVRLLMQPKKLGALTSFAYNVGVGAFAASTMRRLIDRNDYDGAAKQFDVWINAGGVPLRGLVRRRAAERALFEAME